ncbi:MAG TPA: GHMP kinase [Ktedonobacterales bacterium]
MTMEDGVIPAGGARALLAWAGWDADAPIAVGYAPGRLDVMGGIADYSGATVLELPLACGVFAAAQLSDDGLLTAATDGPTAPTLSRTRVDVPLATLTTGAPDGAPERLRRALVECDARWAAYILGPLALLYAAGLLPEISGARLAVWSTVPVGAGVSSSAALEVAVLRALLALVNRDLDPLMLARLAQQSEHRVALAPCGIMDQATAVLGQRDSLLMLRCQPVEVLGYQSLPRDVQVFGLDSGVAHRVGGGQYGRVRCATFMGRAIIDERGAGDPPGGYLCNLPRDRFLTHYAPLLPVEMSGTEFVDRYGDTGDDATQVERDTVYRVRDCTSHAVLEQTNVETFVAALHRYEQSGERPALIEAGGAMYRSHASYGERCGLGTPETDLIVDLVQERGEASGLYGAKITGGGAGGTVAVLAAGPQARDEVERIAAEYTWRTGISARVLAGSGDGALRVPVVWARARPLGGSTHG